MGAGRTPLNTPAQALRWPAGGRAPVAPGASHRGATRPQAAGAGARGAPARRRQGRGRDLARHQEGLGLSGERSGGAGAECPPEGVTMGEALEGPGKPLSVSFESH
jgi:hypothetical protein